MKLIELKEICRKKERKYVLIIIIISVLVLGLEMINFLKKNGLHLLHARVTTRFEEIEYKDGTFLLEAAGNIYIDTSLNLEFVKEQFHVGLKEGDDVYVLCKIYSEEIAPVNLKIYYIIQL